MSHFSVAVFMTDDKQSIDKLLAPYDEELPVETVEGEDGPETFNPEAKWDWYSVGGRWKNWLILKNKGNGSISDKKRKTIYRCDAAYVSEIDFEAMRRHDRANLLPYREIMTRYFNPEYFRERYPTEKEYLECMSLFAPYAVITPDGAWHASGEMGWFGLSDDTPEDKRKWELGFYDRFIKPAIENNWYMVIVDCHI